MDSNEIVSAWYDQNAVLEDSRLKSGRLEYSVTLHYIYMTIRTIQGQNRNDYLRIADIGCGTGVYALPLAQAGHEVSISDISSVELSLARDKAAKQNITFKSAISADACNLRQRPELYRRDYYDLQLWLGPLYHILDRDRRGDAFLTAVEMCRVGGYIAAAFVTRNAHLRDVAIHDPARLHREAEFYGKEGYLTNGRYTRGNGPGMHHTTVKEMREFLVDVIEQAKGVGVVVEVERTVSCEGFLGFRHAESLATLDDEAFQKWLIVILETAEDETTLGCADHILVLLKRVL